MMGESELLLPRIPTPSGEGGGRPKPWGENQHPAATYQNNAHNLRYSSALDT